MSEKTQIGVRVDKRLWEEFKEDVKERKGRVQGVLGHELEIAIQEYIHTKSDDQGRNKIAEFERRLTEVEGEVFGASADGGVDTLDDSTHTRAMDCGTTRAPSRVEVDEKPPANAATEKKIAYLAQCVRDDHGGEFKEIPQSHLIDVVKEEYSFRSDTAKRYVERLVTHFELEGHPTAAGLLVTPDRLEELDEKQREQARLDAEERVSKLTEDE